MSNTIRCACCQVQRPSNQFDVQEEITEKNDPILITSDTDKICGNFIKSFREGLKKGKIRSGEVAAKMYADFMAFRKQDKKA